MLVLDISKDDEEASPHLFINPQIVKRSDEMHIHEEGCLSIPDFRLDIERPAIITVGYIDREGKKQELEADGLLATAIQHEVDHLNGKLIIDFLSRLKRDMVVKRFKKQSRGEAPL